MRFIPAYAGNSDSGISRRRTESVHPRLRGELVNCVNESGLYAGSSPLTRGTQFRGLVKSGRRRFIPAYAGNSGNQPHQFPGRTVHPRLRGELLVSCGLPMLRLGSSPLTRGTLYVSRVVKREIRFIPAYAGNSSQREIASSIKTVHPRLRGELNGVGRRQ